MFAIDESASSFCAREMRGTLSIASTVAFFAASASMSSGCCAGQMKLTSVAPSRSITTSSTSGGRTLKTMSAVTHSCSGSGMIAASPAPDCTATRKPSFASRSTTSGTVATRFSPGAVSRGTPIRCGMRALLNAGEAREAKSYDKRQSARAARASHRSETSLVNFKRALNDQRQGGRRNCAGEQRHVVVEREPGCDALAVAARADERGDGGGADVDHRGGLDAREDRGRGERQLDEPQALARAQAERHGRLAHAAADAGETRVRVAHDRQQRVEEKREQRGNSSDGADERDEKGEERERRDRLDYAHQAEDRLRGARQLCRGYAQRYAGGDRRGERNGDQHEMLARQAPEIATKERGEEPAALAARGCGAAREECRGLREALAFELGRRVHADHQARVDASLERRERAPRLREALRHIAAVEQHRVIAREEMTVVFEHAPAIALDLGVGGVDIHDIDAPGGERLVGEAVIESGGRLPE